MNQKSEIIIYQSKDGLTKVDVKMENETVWLSINQMAELFQTTKQNISLHIQNIFDEGELQEEATVKEYLTVQKEGSRNVKRALQYYNLDVIVAKNYLNEHELNQLNRIVNQYLEFAELQALQRKPMYMKDWVAKLNAFLTLNDRDILNHSGKTSHEAAETFVFAEYEKYKAEERKRLESAEDDLDKAIKRLEAKKKKANGK